MILRSKFLAVEGIDGAGKRTQLDLLSRVLDERGVAYARFAFPRYNLFFGRMVARFLNGEFGPLDAVDPHFSALLFAGDRLEARAELFEALDEGKTVLVDRYIGSNLAHQTARVLPEKREAFLAWLKQLEYSIYRLPAEDLVVYLRLPASMAHRLVAQKAVRDYTRLERDLQEANIAHLEQAAQLYDQLATAPNWVTVQSLDAGSSELRSPGDIHREVMELLEKRAPYMMHRERHRKSGLHDPPRI